MSGVQSRHLSKRNVQESKRRLTISRAIRVGTYLVQDLSWNYEFLWAKFAPLHVRPFWHVNFLKNKKETQNLSWKILSIELIDISESTADKFQKSSGSLVGKYN